MDARMQKHRATRWLWRFVAAQLLVLFATANPAQAMVESIAPEADGGIWRFSDPDQRSPQTSSPDVACNSGYNLYWTGPNGWAYLESVPNRYGYANLGVRDCKFVETKTGIIRWSGSIQRVPFPPACPIPKINPTILYTYKYANGMCEREAQEKLIITLSGGTEVEPSKGSAINTLPFIATVIDQNTTQPPNRAITVDISLKVDSRGGGHDHGDNTRPRGGIAIEGTCPSDATCWSETSPANHGVVVFNFNAPEASGKHTITATCDGCNNNPQTATVDVKVKEADAPGWDTLTASPSDYVLVGGETGKPHHANHYLTAKARRNLQAIIDEYNTQYPAGPRLHLNDASLVWGGKFDVDINVPWLSIYPASHPRAGNRTPHVEHRHGEVIDVRANQDATAIPVGRFVKFEQIAARAGASAKLHCAFSGRYVCPACELDFGSNRHYHVYLLRKNVK